ncbi:hypothetical protein SDC9_89037 [bioreactor metagenome]|uniref:Uncharacterized protein n=1 Tax=bioreactor metagenome TaxID=1076179 RepID=A0A644ZNF2_9ZZZZ
MTARRGELRPAHRQVLRGDDLGRQVEHAEGPRLATVVALTVVAEQDPGPDDRVEDDVVLAHEVGGGGLRIEPPGLPGVRVTGPGRPLDARRQVADHGVEPHVQPLHRLVTPAVQRHRHAPVEVAGDRPRLQVVDQVLGELDHVRPPVLAGLEPLGERLGQRRQVEEEVLGLDELWRLTVDPGARVDQVDRVELVAAVVTLVAAGARVAADRAGALDVAVGQRTPRRRADRPTGRPGHDVTVAVQREEHLLGHAVMVLRRGPGEQVVRQAEPLQVLDDDPVVLVGELADGDALLLRLHRDRGAVLVGAGDHQHLVTAHPHVPRVDIGGYAEAGHVADVARSVRVRPGNSGQHTG